MFFIFITGWQNFQTFSYHTYGGSGIAMYNEQIYLVNSINNPAIPPIITEHNSKTSLNWNMIATTADDYTESPQLYWPK